MFKSERWSAVVAAANVRSGSRSTKTLHDADGLHRSRSVLGGGAAGGQRSRYGAVCWLSREQNDNTMICIERGPNLKSACCG